LGFRLRGPCCTQDAAKSVTASASLSVLSFVALRFRPAKIVADFRPFAGSGSPHFHHPVGAQCIPVYASREMVSHSLVAPACRASRIVRDFQPFADSGQPYFPFLRMAQEGNPAPVYEEVGCLFAVAPSLRRQKIETCRGAFSWGARPCEFFPPHDELQHPWARAHHRPLDSR